jgi:hypothetical protein
MGNTVHGGTTACLPAYYYFVALRRASKVHVSWRARRLEASVAGQTRSSGSRNHIH